LNGKDFPDKVKILDDVSITEKGSPLDLLRPTLRKTTLLLWPLWFVNTCAYYGIVMITPDYFHVDSSNSQYLDVFLTWSLFLF